MESPTHKEVNNNLAQEQELKLQVKGLEIAEAGVKREAWTAETPLSSDEVENIEEFVEVLYDPANLANLKSIQKLTELNPNLLVRPLQIDDYNRGFLQLMSQLTSVGDISYEKFKERFMKLKRCQDSYYNTVIVDTDTDQVIGNANLIIEWKFIHECSKRGLIEEVIVSDHYRGKQLGKLIVATLVELGKSVGCTKITLNCKDQMITFYERLGFVAEENNANFLVIRVPHSS